jgi:hypothetical protein
VDLWLVETVGVLVTAIGIGLAIAVYRGGVPAELAVVAVGSGACLAIIDSVYVARGRISAVNLLDVAIEVCLIAAWAVCWRIQASRRAAR